MSTGADNKTMPLTPEYADNYERIFGKKDVQRGRFVWDEALHTFVPVGEYTPPPTALNAPVMVDRFYEGARAPDPEGTDIGSRRKHREYMHARGLTSSSDFTETWNKAEEARQRIRAGEPIPDPERREQIGRAAYEVEKNARTRR